MTFLWLATPYQILIFSNLILHNILVSKSNSSAYNKFARHKQVLMWRVKLMVLWTLNRQAKIFLRNSSDFKLFIFLRIRCAKLKICEWICVNIRRITWHKFPKASPRTYIFQRGFLVGLYSVPLIIERLNFKMWRLGKELVNESGVGTY